MPKPKKRARTKTELPAPTRASVTFTIREGSDPPLSITVDGGPESPSARAAVADVLDTFVRMLRRQAP